MNIPNLVDGFITWQSSLPCCPNQETPFVDERVFKMVGFAGKRFLSCLPLPLFRTFFALAPIFARSESEKCLTPSESLTEALATQAKT